MLYESGSGKASPFKLVPGTSALDLILRQGLPLVLTTPAVQGNLKGELVGFASPEFLIVRLPLTAGVRSINSGDSIMVRFLADGTIFGFRTEILSLVTKPAPLLVLNYPDTIEKRELRKDKRINCLLPARLEVAEVFFPSMVTDLSRSGCRLAAKLQGNEVLTGIPKESLLVLHLNLSNESGGYALPVLVKNVQYTNEAVTLGLSFQDPDPAAQQGIDSYLLTAEGFLA